MSEFIQIAKVSEITENEIHLHEVDDRLVILVRNGDEIHCIDDVCTHDGGTLSDGSLQDCRISCPRHGAQFDVKTGAALSMPATEPTASHEVKVDGDDVYVKINEV